MPPEMTNLRRSVAYAIRHHVPPTKAFRVYIGITPDKLAEEARLPYHRVLEIENGGSMSNVEAKRLSDALEVPTYVLRGRRSA